MHLYLGVKGPALRCCLCREWRVASVASRACRCVGSRAGSAVTLPVTLRYATSRYATLRYGPPWPPLPPLSPSVRDLSIYVRPPPLTRLHLWCARPSAKHRAAPRSTTISQGFGKHLAERATCLPGGQRANSLNLMTCLSDRRHRGGHLVLPHAPAWREVWGGGYVTFGYYA